VETTKLKKRIVALTAHKGGVGKTTLSTILASFLAIHGADVVLADLDGQGQVADWWGIAPTPGVYNTLTRQAVTAESQLVEVPRAQWDARRFAPTGGEPGRLLVLPGDRTTGQVWTECDDPRRLRDKLLALITDGVADWIILDAPPAIGEEAINILVAAGRVIIPVEPGYLAVRGVVNTLETMQIVAQETADWGHDRADATLIGIVPNRSKAASLHSANLAALTGTWNGAVWPPIKDIIAHQEAPQNRMSIFALDADPRLRSDSSRIAVSHALRFGRTFLEVVQHGE